MENRKQKEENEMEIDLVSLFFYLLDKWKLLFLGAVVGVVLEGALVFFQTPMYEVELNPVCAVQNNQHYIYNRSAGRNGTDVRFFRYRHQ